MNQSQWPLVYITIVNYKGYDDTIECLDSWAKSNYTNIQLVVVDNASPDDCYERLQIAEKSRGDFVLLQSGYDGGWPGGCNFGMAWALEKGAEFVCFVDNDTVADPDFLRFLMETMLKDKNYGVVGGKILSYRWPERVANAGGLYFPALGYAWARDRHTDRRGEDKTQVVDWVTAGILVRRAAIQRVGKMREDYFHHTSDVEWPMRIKRNGFKVVYQPKARIYHKGESVEKGNHAYSYYYERRNSIYLLMDQFGAASLFGIAVRVFKMFIDVLLSSFTGQKYMPRLVARILGDISRNRRGQADLSDFKNPTV